MERKSILAGGGITIRVIEKIVDWTLDKYIGVGLVLTLFLSMLLGLDTTIQTNIISGLIGYMSKTVMVERKDNDYGKSKKRH